MSHIFHPTSPFWRVNREWIIALAGPRAVLLEVAHPLVAAGVAQHSRYRTDPFGRLYRTLRLMTHITFGDADTALGGARAFRHRHQQVRGALSNEVGPYLAGTRYHAHDPLLKLWVLATLIDSTLRVYERFVTPLSLEDKQAYYRDAQRLAEVMGIPRPLTPPTYADFLNYMDAMLTSDMLTVGDDARAIVAALFRPPLFGPLARGLFSFTAGLLPPHLREAYHLAWDDRAEQRLDHVAAFSRRFWLALPSVIRAHPKAVNSERQWRERNGQLSFIGRH